MKQQPIPVFLSGKSHEVAKSQTRLRHWHFHFSLSISLTTLKPLTVWITTNCGKFLEIGIPDHLTCLLRNLCADQEATVRTNYGTTDCFKIGKVIGQSCILSPYLFNLYAKYIMRNARLEEAQAGIKIAERNINNLRYADDTTLMARKLRRTNEPLDESERGDWKSWIKTQHPEN